MSVARLSARCSDGSALHPGLYPVLMVLGRLFPSVIEGVDSTLNISAFIPAVVKLVFYVLMSGPFLSRVL